MVSFAISRPFAQVPPLHTAPIFMHRGISNTKATATRCRTGST